MEGRITIQITVIKEEYQIMSQTIVIFGASGDLTSRKLIPALYQLRKKARLPENTRIVGFSRSEISSEQWRARLAETTLQFTGSDFDTSTWNSFAENLFYFPGNMENTDDYIRLNDFLDQLEQNQPVGRIFYLAVAPQLYKTTVENLGQTHMSRQSQAFRRIVLEKPFGSNYQTAVELNQFIHNWFDEDQIYRIDHYLGKETVANIMVLRFANTIFEPIWNRNYIDNVQITAAEDTLIGRRAEYYERSGVLRDMFQNHLLQLLILTTMESPARFDPDIVRDEKVKVLRAIRPITPQKAAVDSIRGQYRSYRDEPKVNPHSQTATYGAVKFEIENWRWQSVPFYLRSGKAMSCRTTQIVIQFKQPPHFIFDTDTKYQTQPNQLVLQIQPAEGIKMYFQTKVPDQGMNMRQTSLDFNFQQGFSTKMPDSYQRLLLDVINGDASLFARADEVELAWNVIDPIQQAWDSGTPNLDLYEAGFWGPEQSVTWLEKQNNRQWFDVCPVI